MKRLLLLLLAAAMLISLAACGMKDMIQDKARDMLGGATAPATAAGKQSGPSGESGTTPSGNKRPIASAANPGGYWERLRQEWDSAPEEGYVWTVTFDSTETLSMMGLVKVDYTLKLSCSHVGKDIRGIYRGEMDMSYSANLDGMAQLLTLTGGSVDYDADGWFKNDEFIMDAYSYDADEEDTFVQSFQPESDMSADEQAIVDMYMNQFLGGLGGGMKDFELDDPPAAYWYDWDFRMTEGDMSGYINMSGIAYGTTSGSGGVDSSGVYSGGSAHSILGYSERYSEVIETPFPYIIRLYETGEAVFELHSANGGPVTVKFYGTVDKIPVEDTIVVKK